MHGRMHPNYWQITILLVVDLCSSLAYFMMTQPLPIAGKLPIKTLVAKQLPTNNYIPYSTKFSLDKNFAQCSCFVLNTPCPNIWYRIRTCAIRSISLYVPHFLLPLVFTCCTPFTAALASAMAEGDSSVDRGPEGSGIPEEQRVMEVG